MDLQYRDNKKAKGFQPSAREISTQQKGRGRNARSLYLINFINR